MVSLRSLRRYDVRTCAGAGSHRRRSRFAGTGLLGGCRACAYHRSVITGVHAVVFSPAAEQVRAFFADVLAMPGTDAGGGWPVFALPPAELAVHPSDGRNRHELYLMCDDIHATLAELSGRGAEVARDVTDQGWGLLAAIRLPDGSELPVYQPRHPSPHGRP